MMQKLITKIEKEIDNLTFTLNYLKHNLDSKTSDKRKQIIQSLSDVPVITFRKRKKLRWNQRPENRAKMMKAIRKMIKAKKKNG